MTALLLCIGTPVGSLEDIAKQGAAALELAHRSTAASPPAYLVGTGIRCCPLWRRPFVSGTIDNPQRRRA